MNKAALDKILSPLNSFWEGMDKNKKIRFFVLLAVVLTAIVLSVIFLNHKNYVVLYNNMDSKDAGEVLKKLQEMKIDAKPQGEGTILVPEGVQDTVRMELSAEGLPKSGMNYDVFANSTGFGTTEFEKQKYLQFQLQERLQNSIKTLENVADAIVTLNIPDNSSFVLKEDKQEASASVIIKLKNKEELTKDQIKGIEGLVAKSVPGLKEEQVLMIDGMGNNLKAVTDKNAELAGTQLELENNISEKLQQQVISLLEPVFGAGNVTAGVRVSLDFDKKTTESLKYDPVGEGDEGIPISSSEASETATNGNNSGAVGQDQNGGAPQYVQSNTGNGEYKKVNKTTNYEVNQIKDTIQKAEGQIKNISVSVLLDENDLQTGADQKVKEIVAGAVGVPAENVTVQSMSFNGENNINKIFDDIQKNNSQLKKQALLRNALIFGALGIILILAALLIFKTLKKKDTVEENNYETDLQPIKSETDDVEFTINKSEKRALIEKSIEKNPELVAQLLRNWLNDEVRL